MHKGWGVAVVIVAAQMLIGGVSYYSAHKDDGTQPADSDISVEPANGINEMLETSELMFLAGDSIGTLPESVVEDTGCARVCAIPGKDSELLSGGCSIPMVMKRLLDSGQLVVTVPAQIAAQSYPYLAARERRLLLVPTSQCPPQNDDPVTAVEDEKAGETM